jgi:hypothetical protein
MSYAGEPQSPRVPKDFRVGDQVVPCGVTSIGEEVITTSLSGEGSSVVATR